MLDFNFRVFKKRLCNNGVEIPDTRTDITSYIQGLLADPEMCRVIPAPERSLGSVCTGLSQLAALPEPEAGVPGVPGGE